MIDVKRQEEAFEKLNKKTKKTKLGEVISIVDGLTYKPSDITNDINDLGVLRSSNIKNGKLNLTSMVNVNLKVDDLKYTKTNDILVCVRNGSKSLIGKSCLIDKELVNFTHGAFMTIIRTEEYKYIHALLNSTVIKREINKDLGATINQITKSNLKNYTYNEHEHKFRNYIAEFLTSLDELIQKQEEYIEMLKIKKKGYCYKIYNQQLRFMGFKKNWEYKKINELAEVISGGTPNTRIKTYWNGNIEWYTPSEVSFGKKPKQSIRKITIEGLNASSAKLLPIGTILFTSRATIGDMLILEKEATTNQGFQSIICNDLLYNKFLINDINFIKMTKKLSSGSTFEEISGKEVKNIKIRIPNYEEQKKIGDFVSAQIEKIELHEKKLELLKIKKKYYLQEIFQ